MPAVLLPLIAQVGMWLINYFISRKIVSDESKKIFIQVAEELRVLGAVNVKSRFEAEVQLDSNDKEWTNREAKK